MWSYSNITNAPEGCCLRDANELISASDARNWLKRGFCIHHVADIVRLLAVKHYPSQKRVGRAHLLSGKVNEELDARMLSSTWSNNKSDQIIKN